MPRIMILLALTALTALAACAQRAALEPGGGPPGPALGSPVLAVETTGRTGLRVLGLTQGRLRACSGSYPPPTAASPRRTTELSCTGGVTGTATVGPGAGGRRSVRWALDTGESGRAEL